MEHREDIPGFGEHLGAVARLIDVVADGASEDTVFEGKKFFLSLLDRSDFDAVERTAIFFGDDHILRDVDKAACQVSGVGRFKGGIGKTFTGTVRGDEVFENA